MPPSVEKAHDPSSRLAAIVLIRIVSASAAAPSSKVTLAVSLTMKLGPLLSVGHSCSGYLICVSRASLSSAPANSASAVGRLTPAMVAGVTDRLWEVVDIVKVLEDWEENQ
jgi:hypothetical protein